MKENYTDFGGKYAKVVGIRDKNSMSYKQAKADLDAVYALISGEKGLSPETDNLVTNAEEKMKVFITP